MILRLEVGMLVAYLLKRCSEKNSKVTFVFCTKGYKLYVLRYTFIMEQERGQKKAALSTLAKKNVKRTTYNVQLH
jgi:hypothetical protein